MTYDKTDADQWEGYGYVDAHGHLTVVLHGFEESRLPIQIVIDGVAPRKVGATVFAARATRVVS